MSPAFPNAQRSSAEVRFWKDQPSASEIAERLARSHIDKQELESRLDELLHENNILRLQCTATATELEDEQKRLKGEIDSLRGQLDARQTGVGRHKAEFERKLETLQVELNRERQRSARQLEEFEARLTNCICGAVQMAPKPSSPSSGLPKRWVIRNSK